MVQLGHVKVDVNKVVPNTISHDPLAAHVIQKLRDIAGKPQPAFRMRVQVSYIQYLFEMDVISQNIEI